MYLTYEEYKSFGGTLDETAFNNFEFEAENLINWYTFNRLKGETEIPEAVKRCAFKLINIACLKAQALSVGQSDNSETAAAVSGGAAVKSFSNDGVSISFNTMDASEAYKQSKNEIRDTVQMYLNGVTNSKGVKLTYRGMYPGEERGMF